MTRQQLAMEVHRRYFSELESPAWSPGKACLLVEAGTLSLAQARRAFAGLEEWERATRHFSKKLGKPFQGFTAGREVFCEDLRKAVELVTRRMDGD